MRVLGVDLGSKRIGLAVSDPEGEFAFPVGAIAAQGGRKDVEAVCAIVKEREVERVVVGLPLHMDGRAGPEAEAAKRFANALARASGLEVDTLDERWTSAEAERSLAAPGRASKQAGRRRRQRGDVDAAAAAIILRTWLERERGRHA